MEFMIIKYISIFLALMVVLSFHEFAHAYAAVKNGDYTPKLMGRYTLNPLAHFDLVGLCCFALVGFGWAKPVPVNPRNFNNYKKGSIWVAIAGVLANFILAFITYPLHYLSLYLPSIGYFTEVLMLTLGYVHSFSLTFIVFNLLPIYPLDGFRLYDSLSNKRGKVYWFLREKGMYVLYGLFFLGILSNALSIPQINVLGTILDFLTNIIAFPITMFWMLIGGLVL